MTALVLATANLNKAGEVRSLFEGTGIDIVVAAELDPEWDVEETGETLEENARQKALAAVARTGRTSIADDTGLFVDALGGAPGVHSARYAGPGARYADNVRKLLMALEGIPEGRRSARFRTVAYVATPEGRERAFEGVLEGSILAEPRGVYGFGYDPVFLVAGTDRSLAELSLEAKNRSSHRARAFRAAADFLTQGEGWLSEVGLETPSTRSSS